MSKSVLKLIDGKNYLEGIINILRKEGNGKNIIYVTTGMSHSSFSAPLKKAGIKEENIFFIDCTVQGYSDEAVNCVCIGNSPSMASISIAVNESLRSFSGSKLLIMDSLSTFAIYNDSDTQKFFEFLFSKMRFYDVDKVILAVESNSKKEYIEKLKLIVDEVEEDGNKS